MRGVAEGRGEVQEESMTVTLNIAFGDHARVEPLKDGTVKPEGIELNWINTGSGWIFHRNLYYDEFDVSEMSISSTLVAIERRVRRLRDVYILNAGGHRTTRQYRQVGLVGPARVP
jgi:4,5-dihydroxyphthalate decarboxylase